LKEKRDERWDQERVKRNKDRVKNKGYFVKKIGQNT
jgi:hypothetical protein